MANLYEIDRCILDCIDADTGEIIDCERLEGLLMDKQSKIENIALWVKNLESDALAFGAEKAAFAEREKKAKAKAEQLRQYLGLVLNGEKFSTAKCAVSFRRSASVRVDNIDLIPNEFKRTVTTVEADKTAIKAAIKAGTDVAGCALVEKLNTQIK